jgi:hypothetical protein
MLHLLLALVGLLGLIFVMGVSRDIAISAFLIGDPDRLAHPARRHTSLRAASMAG